MGNTVAGQTCRGAASWYPAAPLNGADASSLYTLAGARKYLNGTERGRLLAEVDNLPRDQALFPLTLAWTGARVSEVLALTAVSFDTERSVVALRTLKRRAFNIREVPIPPWLTSQLDQHFGLVKAQRDPETAHRRLWAFHRVTAWRQIKRVMIRADIFGVAASPRGLRHSYAVGSLHANVPITTLQKLMGHARMSSTAVYTHVCGEEEITLAARFWQLDQAEVLHSVPGTGHSSP